MKKIKLFRDYKDLENKFIKTTVAIGNFDGLHLGHQGLLKKAKNLSIHSNSKLLVFTFFPMASILPFSPIINPPISLIEL